VEPTKSTSSGRIQDAALRAGQLSFAVRNTGTVHFVVQSIKLTGYGPAGERVLEGALEGWYVLPGGTRRYDLPLSRRRLPPDPLARYRGADHRLQPERAHRGVRRRLRAVTRRAPG
jgi:hypothetical protein